MSRKCCVCEGTIVNGRCTWCGMPAKSDLTLYHLNEDRSTHMGHASGRERKAIRESSIPYADRKPQNTIRSSSGRSAQNMTETAASRAARKKAEKNFGSANTGKKKKGGLLRLILALTVLFTLFPGAWDYLERLFRRLYFTVYYSYLYH